MVEDYPLGEQQLEYLEDVKVKMGNAGADEHSIIAQSDAAITPGSKTPLLHLFGSAVIPPELYGHYSYLAGSSYADHEIELTDLPIEDMEYGGQLMIASLQMSNSVNGRNQDAKFRMIAPAGLLQRALGRFSRRGRGYESSSNNE